MSFVEKLRAWSEDSALAHPDNLRRVIGEAADHIEKLEAKLEERFWDEMFDRTVPGSKHDMRGV